MNSSDPTSGIDTVPVVPPQTVTVYGKKIMLVMPWQKMVNPITAFSAFQLADRRRTTTALNFGDAFVTHSRNNCADVFLASDCEYMLTIDDDMVVPFGNAKWFKSYTGWSWYPEPFASFNALDRLMSHKKTLVGALYFAKHSRGAPVFGEGNREQMSEHVRRGPHDEVKLTGWVGTGCMLIHRSVYLDMEKTYPRLARGPDGKGGQWFTSTEHKIMDGVKQVMDMLSVGPMDGPKAMRAYELLVGLNNDASRVSKLGVGEDVIFCRRAAESGHQCFIDLGLICGHLGIGCYGPRNTGQK